MKRCIIVGGGHAGAEAAFELRKKGWQGEIVLISAESYLPYHRPPISKTYLTGETPLKRLYIKPAAAYEKANICIKLTTKVVDIKPLEHTVTLDSGELLTYDKLILCTGCSSRKLTVPGAELDNVFSIRTLDDIEHIARTLGSNQPPKHIVMIGGGYIGLETAASFKKLGHHVTILERSSRILNRIAAEPIAAHITKLHQAQGVNIFTDKSVTALTGEHAVQAVYCSEGESFKADIVVIGVGAEPNTCLANYAGLQTKQGRIEVNQQGKTSVPDIYAAGDCTIGIEPFSGQNTTLESVPSAVQQAKMVAATICEVPQPQIQVPWFWSDIFDCKLQIAGLYQGYDTVIERVYNCDSKSYWYVKSHKIIAVTCINCPSDFQAGKKILKENITISLSELKNVVNPIIPNTSPVPA
ncbi:NAD(P)/FAD-dependent oxidoreductase [Pseudoalteromonas peptidolytica]|uniref:3-phenylpropionate/trans-cinnamate dioxygenase ferredoxin reductase subunit n=1 Tax=Pseudoalteromonas peptidolytica F12-50-A1 TaxID=1315280 RepID=A0A8I0T3E6_9GAMM|nr:FAD-dependent oxidoreductase [Pseudoalteromonas peptidolytica]MBE0345870.1 3-phenylpropionate/trans-cinnamate dioxygenase ferredoxin reductase subunit [Pseudoalteromonas peptidolytica F12-50-A1]NLR16045.1 pyridine nucleotide-disulfide oxidoreductase [Pseudoalteromonas peptidolytica]GEK08718.1 putative ferredoxin reductase [Pseudoalteromonas peptidolytica]